MAARRRGRTAAMSAHAALAVAALAGSILLVAFSSSRLVAIVAIVASGLEVLMHLGILRLGYHGLPVPLVLGLALAVPGAVSWLRATGKSAISGATIVALVGIVQVVLALGVRV
jgi:hypothetical protein